MKEYYLGLLYLVHLLISSDGVVDDSEKRALLKIKDKENIPDDVFKAFEHDVKTKKERFIFENGVEMINACSLDQKLRAFGILYKMSEVDGRVHVKEVRLLLYSTRAAGIDFDDVVETARKLPTYYQ